MHKYLKSVYVNNSFRATRPTSGTDRIISVSATRRNSPSAKTTCRLFFFNYLTFKSTGLQEKVNNCRKKPGRRWLTAGMGRRGHWKKCKGRDLNRVHESSLSSPTTPTTPTSQTLCFVLQVGDLLSYIFSAGKIYFCIKVTQTEP